MSSTYGKRAGIGPIEAGQDIKKRCLPTTGRADKRTNSSRRTSKGNPTQDNLCAKTLVEPSDRDHFSANARPRNSAKALPPSVVQNCQWDVSKLNRPRRTPMLETTTPTKPSNSKPTNPALVLR